MRKHLLLLTALTLSLLTFPAFANDGEFHISGNHLIPISNTDIKIVKEVLTIRLCDSTENTFVDVDYTFVNTSSTPKTIKMGFEAKIEDNEAQLPPEKHKGHPNIWDFKVKLNGKHIPSVKIFLLHLSGVFREYDFFYFQGPFFPSQLFFLQF